MDTSILHRFLRPEIIAMMVPIVAIITFGGLAVIRAVLVHRERIAMIEHGIHPDYPPEDDEAEENAARTDQYGNTASHQLGNRSAALDAR